jgi:hypothetical protein
MREAVAAGSKPVAGLRTANNIRAALLSAGFQVAPSAPARIAGWEGAEMAEFVGTVPSYKKGATTRLPFSFSKKRKSSPKAASAWKIDDASAGAIDLLDEDDLLADGLDLQKKPADEMDCGTSKGGKRRACKNCSCGLAETIAEATEAEIEAAMKNKSDCGNCAKGDAFRCESCPHRGKPKWNPEEQFEPGEKVVLKL